MRVLIRRRRTVIRAAIIGALFGAFVDAAAVRFLGANDPPYFDRPPDPCEMPQCHPDCFDDAP